MASEIIEGDNVILSDSVDIHDGYARHGIVLTKNRTMNGCGALQILFVDGVVEDYYPHEVRELTDKEWFRLQLGASIGQ